MSTTSGFERMGRGVALRVTRPRVAVLSAAHDHPHAHTVIVVVREKLGEVSHQAVYDVPRYEVRVGDNHHHVVCRSCGAIADVDCAVGYTPCLTARPTSRATSHQMETVRQEKDRRV